MRVCHVELEGEGKFGITQAKYRLSEEQKQEDGEKLFDFCAECLGKSALFPSLSLAASSWMMLRGR